MKRLWDASQDFFCFSLQFFFKSRRYQEWLISYQAGLRVHPHVEYVFVGVDTDVNVWHSFVCLLKNDGAIGPYVL